jgi:hypothetical protein
VRGRRGEVVTTLTGAAPPPPRYKTGECRSCHARIIWAVIATNLRRVCVDAEPVDVNTGNGDVLLTDRGRNVAPAAELLTAATRAVRLFGKRWVYRRHIDTCPYRKHHINKAVRAKRTRP